MKKIFFALLSLFMAGFSFANTEIAFNYEHIKKEQIPLLNVETSGNGAGVDFSFFFGKGNSPFEAGLGLSTSGAVLNNASTSKKITKYQQTPLTLNLGLKGDSPFITEYDIFIANQFGVIAGSGYEISNYELNDAFVYTLGIGPVFRYTFNKHFSLFARPAVYGNIISGTLDYVGQRTIDSFYYNSAITSKLTMSQLYMADLLLRSAILSSDYIAVSGTFDLNFGGRAWLVNNPGFHFGLDFGFDISAKTNSYVEWNETGKTYTPNERLGYKFYLGACLNLGDRRFDK